MHLKTHNKSSDVKRFGQVSQDAHPSLLAHHSCPHAWFRRPKDRCHPWPWPQRLATRDCIGTTCLLAIKSCLELILLSALRTALCRLGLRCQSPWRSVWNLVAMCWILQSWSSCHLLFGSPSYFFHSFWSLLHSLSTVSILDSLPFRELTRPLSPRKSNPKHAIACSILQLWKPINCCCQCDAEITSRGAWDQAQLPL